MAENKKSFVAYCDWGEIFDGLSNEDAGKLVKHLFDYVRDKEPESDQLTSLLFISIRQSLKRDLKKYEQYIDKQKVNGSKGGRPKKPKEPNPFFGNPTEPKKADSVNDSVNDNDNEIKNEGAITQESFLKLFKELREAKGLVTNIKKLGYDDLRNLNNLKDYDISDFTKAINSMLDDKWAKDNNQLLPSHLLKEANFIKYLNVEQKKKLTIQELIAGKTN